MPFIDRMDLAYAAADVVVGRAGALSISELALVGKASVLIPSPNVAEDHQTKNAKALERVGAAILLADKDAEEGILKIPMDLLREETDRKKLEENIRSLGIQDADERIATEVLQLIKNER